MTTDRRYARPIPGLTLNDQFDYGPSLIVQSLDHGLAGGWHNPMSTPALVRIGTESVGLHMREVIRLRDHLSRIITEAGPPLPADFFDRATDEGERP